MAVYQAVQNETKNEGNLYSTFRDFLKKSLFSAVYVDFSEHGIFFRGETFFRCFISILSRFWPKISKIWWVISEKSAKNLNFDWFSWILRRTWFFFENRASSLKIVYSRLTWCKKSEESNGGKYENSVGRTDGLTDGAGYIGPFPLRRGGSKKKSKHEIDQSQENFKFIKMIAKTDRQIKINSIQLDSTY